MSQNDFNVILNLQHFFVYFENRVQSQLTMKYKIDMSFPQKYYSQSFFVTSNFTLRLLKNIPRQSDSALMNYIYVACRPKRENK